jgi:hypothetical protein
VPPSCWRPVVKKGKKTVEVVYLITSDRTAEPETLPGPWFLLTRKVCSARWLRRVADEGSCVAICRARPSAKASAQEPSSVDVSVPGEGVD